MAGNGIDCKGMCARVRREQTAVCGGRLAILVRRERERTREGMQEALLCLLIALRWSPDWQLQSTLDARQTERDMGKEQQISDNRLSERERKGRREQQGDPRVTTGKTGDRQRSLSVCLVACTRETGQSRGCPHACTPAHMQADRETNDKRADQ